VTNNKDQKGIRNYLSVSSQAVLEKTQERKSSRGEALSRMNRSIGLGTIFLARLLDDITEWLVRYPHFVPIDLISETTNACGSRFKE
jgi:uncharacterized membrane protein